jgi:thioredoxin 1
MSKLVSEISDSQFEIEVLKSEIPVLVDFWAPWCGPCISITPLIEGLAQEYSGKVKFVKVNVDDNREYATRYNVRGIPNLILFKDGELHEQIVGTIGKEDLSAVIQKVM